MTRVALVPVVICVVLVVQQLSIEDCIHTRVAALFADLTVTLYVNSWLLSGPPMVALILKPETVVLHDDVHPHRSLRLPLLPRPKLAKTLLRSCSWMLSWDS